MADVQTRDELLARLADVLRRSAVEDAEQLVRLLEVNLPAKIREKAEVRLDGMYQSSREEGSWGYLRFYADGAVITVGSTGTPAQVRRWFRRDNDQSAGTFVVTGARITFSSTSDDGTVDYEGDVDEDALRLRWFSHINGANGGDTYRFVPDPVS